MWLDCIATCTGTGRWWWCLGWRCILAERWNYPLDNGKLWTYRPSALPTRKKGWGLSHHLTGGLLCPVNYDWADSRSVGHIKWLHVGLRCLTVYAHPYKNIIQTFESLHLAGQDSSIQAMCTIWMNLPRVYSRVICSSRYVANPC